MIERRIILLRLLSIKIYQKFFQFQSSDLTLFFFPLTFFTQTKFSVKILLIFIFFSLHLIYTITIMLLLTFI